MSKEDSFNSYRFRQGLSELSSLIRQEEELEFRLEDPSLSSEERRDLEKKLDRTREQKRTKVPILPK